MLNFSSVFFFFFFRIQSVHKRDCRTCSSHWPLQTPLTISAASATIREHNAANSSGGSGTSKRPTVGDIFNDHGHSPREKYGKNFNVMTYMNMMGCDAM
jgi:hypothetical protein